MAAMDAAEFVLSFDSKHAEIQRNILLKIAHRVEGNMAVLLK